MGTESSIALLAFRTVLSNVVRFDIVLEIVSSIMVSPALVASKVELIKSKELIKLVVNGVLTLQTRTIPAALKIIPKIAAMMNV
jgi:hypothetical protein